MSISSKIVVYDDFLPKNILDAINQELPKLKYYNDKDHPMMEVDKEFITVKGEHKYGKWPGIRTNSLTLVSPVIDKLILNTLESKKSEFTKNKFTYVNFAHLRVASDNEEDFIHQDEICNFSWLLYMSKTNLNSGTKMYTDCDSDKDKHEYFVEFVQNRFVLFDSLIPHMAWGNHGKDFTDGRVTINGFCTYV